MVSIDHKEEGLPQAAIATAAIPFCVKENELSDDKKRSAWTGICAGREREGKMGTKRRKKPVLRREIAVVLCILFLLVVITSMVLLARYLYISLFAKDELQGTWTYDNVTSYAFDGKGEGSLIVDSASYPFTYRLEEDTLSIVFENSAAENATYIYEIQEDVLMLTPENTDGAGSLSFTRVADDGS